MSTTGLSMGRVRKYKKIKACDPFAKRKKAEVDVVHDEPPEIFENKVKRDAKRKERDWEDTGSELFLQREALRSIKLAEEQAHKQEHSIEGKREDETMKAFKQRVRQETRVTLRDELKSLSSTAKNRKEKLKARTSVKKLKRRQALGEEAPIEEDLNEFSQSADGRLRPSDLGASAFFKEADHVSFGERAERPPDLKPFAHKLKSSKSKSGEVGGEGGGIGMIQTDGGLKGSKKDKSKKVIGTETSDGDNRSGGDEEGQESGDGRNSKKKKKKTTLDHMFHADTEMEGGGDAGRIAEILSAGGAGNKKVAGGGSVSVDEMDLLRTKVQDAYKAVKARRVAQRSF